MPNKLDTCIDWWVADRRRTMFTRTKQWNEENMKCS